MRLRPNRHSPAPKLGDVTPAPPGSRLVAALSDLRRTMRIWRVLSHDADAVRVAFGGGGRRARPELFTAAAFRRDFEATASLIPQFDDGNPLEEASLTFTVSVCLADWEYSSACRERSLLEAAKRLEQIYLDVYAMRRAAGSLRIWFPPHVERSEQLWFLRQVEDLAIAAMAKKLQNGGPMNRLPLKWIRWDHTATTQPRTNRALRRCESGVKTQPWRRGTERIGLMIGRRGRTHTKREWRFANLSS